MNTGFKKILVLNLVLVLLSSFSLAKEILLDIPAKSFRKHSIYLGKFHAGKEDIDLSAAFNFQEEGNEDHIINWVIGTFSQNNYDVFFKDPEMTCQEKMDKADDLMDIHIQTNTTNNQYFSKSKLMLPYSEKGHFLFFALFDCHDEYHQFHGRKKDIKLKLTVFFEDYQLESYEFTLIWFKGFGAVGFFLFLLFNVKRYIQETRAPDIEANYAFMTVYVASFLKTFSLLLEILNLMIKEAFGNGYFWLDFGGKCIDMLSSFMVVVLIVFLGSGWTIFYHDLGDLEIFLPFSIAVFLVKLIIFAIDRGVLEEEDDFHSHYGLTGGISASFYLGLFVTYLKMVSDNREKIKANANAQGFYAQLNILAGMYILAFPIIFITSFMMEYGMIAIWFETGSILSQGLSMGALTYMLAAKKGRYRKIADFEFGLPSNSSID